MTATTAAATASLGTVLIVDDVESNRYVLSMWLRRAGYAVVEAATGQEALDAVDLIPPDVVVLDINLPDMSGYEVCESIKSHARTSAVPILHLSATAVQAADRAEGLRRGADVYMVEPVEREELLASVHALLRFSSSRRTALRLAGRLRRLNDATLELNAASNAEQLVTAIVRGASSVFETEVLAFIVVDERGMAARLRPGGTTHFLPVEADQVRRIERSSRTPGPVAAGLLRRAEAIGAEGRWRVSALSDRSGGYQGAVFVAVDATDDDDPTETDLVLAQFSQAAGISIENVGSYSIEHRIALTLQRSLLPDVLPSITGVDVAARYEAGAEHAEVGGDFYEIFELDDDHVVIAVGDVVGHSLQAAAVMSQLRNGIRAYALEGHSPAETLRRLNALLVRFTPDTTATVCYALYQRSTSRCTVANAGHPPPLLIGPTEAAFLPCGGPLLGLDNATWTPTVTDLPDDSVLVFFTDGLIERRHENLDVGLARVVSSVAAGHEDLEELCDRLLVEVGPGSAATDDIAIIAIRPRSRFGPRGEGTV